MTSQQLHGILGKLHRDRVNLDLSERQEWFWEKICEELQRRRNRTPAGERCSCWYCLDDPISWLG